MATHTNPTITDAWALLVASTDAFFVSSPAAGADYAPTNPTNATHPTIELAPADSPPAAGTRGHPLSAMHREAAQRDGLFADGNIYARVAPGQTVTSATVVLTVWPK